MPEQSGRYFGDEIFKLIHLKEDILHLYYMSLKFVHLGQINSASYVTVWNWTGDNSLPRAIMTQITVCVFFLSSFQLIL